MGPSHISGTVPQELSTLPLRRFYIDNSLLAGTIPEMPSRIQDFGMRGNKYISGTLPASLGTSLLRHPFLTGNARVSGSLPTICGFQDMLQQFTRGLDRISGTIPALPHPDHPSAGESESCIGPLALGELLITTNKKVSGTIPENWACTPSKTFGENLTSAFKTMTLLEFSYSSLSGTVPPCMFRGLSRVDTLT
jgi:hypothetical protein